jgi:phosphatidylethanolamine-binding protein (PEBP) family uncharacterized protein
VEPRKGAERRLAPKAKATSATLALVAAALLIVSGCGGDSGPETQSTSASSPAQQAGEADSQASAPAGSGEPGKAAAKSQPPASAPQGQGAGARQGSSVPLPSEEGRERGPTPQEEAEATIADMTLTSPVLIGPEGSLPSRYTCEGKDVWPPLQWGGTPEGSEELILFAMSSQPVEGKLFFAWALAGIDAGLAEIEEGRLPPGAISGRNSFGKNDYSVCPASGGVETYVFALFALPQKLSPAKGFDPARLRREVLEVSGNVGLLGVSYRR